MRMNQLQHIRENRESKDYKLQIIEDLSKEIPPIEIRKMKTNIKEALFKPKNKKTAEIKYIMKTEKEITPTISDKNEMIIHIISLIRSFSYVLTI